MKKLIIVMFLVVALATLNIHAASDSPQPRQIFISYSTDYRVVRSVINDPDFGIRSAYIISYIGQFMYGTPIFNNLIFQIFLFEGGIEYAIIAELKDKSILQISPKAEADLVFIKDGKSSEVFPGLCQYQFKYKDAPAYSFFLIPYATCFLADVTANSLKFFLAILDNPILAIKYKDVMMEFTTTYIYHIKSMKSILTSILEYIHTLPVDKLTITDKILLSNIPSYIKE